MLSHDNTSISDNNNNHDDIPALLRQLRDQLKPIELTYCLQVEDAPMHVGLHRTCS